MPGLAWRLKTALKGQILLAGSFQLLRLLLDADIVDELRLRIYPVVLGGGKRLFGEIDKVKRCASSISRRSLTESPSSHIAPSETQSRRGVEA